MELLPSNMQLERRGKHLEKNRVTNRSLIGPF